MSSQVSEITVNIRGIAVGGAAVGEVIEQANGRTDLLGIAAFVPFAAPGETVAARVVDLKKRHLTAELSSVNKPSPSRVSPDCKFFGVCGGCDLQHVTYETQLKAKRAMIEGSLRAARVSEEVLTALSPVQAGEPYGYRRRVTLHINSQGRIGFYQAGSRSLVVVDQCSVAVSAINEVLANIQNLGLPLEGRVSSILLEADEKGVIAVCKAPYDLTHDEVNGIISSAKGVFSSFRVMSRNRDLGGFGRQFLEVPLLANNSISLHVPAGSFSQVNLEVNISLIESVVKYAAVGFGESVLDLYAGAGNFSLPLAQQGASVQAVDLDKALVRYGRQNTSRLGFDGKVEFFESPVEKFLEKKRKELKPDVIVADPPRSGLGARVIGALPETSRLILVFCHLPSLVRDVKMLSEQGWKVRIILPFDMFAQTAYLETLVVLER